MFSSHQVPYNTEFLLYPGPLGDEKIFAVLYVSLCYGLYTLL